MKTDRSGVFRRTALQTVWLAAALTAGCLAAAAQDVTPATCAADGRNYQPGEIACIPACHGQQRLAKCERTDGGVSWTNISESCPNANLHLTPRPFALANFSGNMNWSEGIRLVLR